MTTMTKMMAINSIQHCSGLESEVTGYREDGSPITKLIRQIYEPGDVFEATDADVVRFEALGVATTDLTHVVPESSDVRG